MATAEQAPPPSCSESSWLSYLTYGWLDQLLEDGRERQVNFADIPLLAPKEDTVSNTQALLANLDFMEKERRLHPLIQSVLATYWKQLLTFEMLMVVSHFLGLLNPFLLQQILIFQETQNKDKNMSNRAITIGLTAVAAFIVLGMFMILYDSQVNFFKNRFNYRMNSALRGAVLVRCVQGTTSASRASSHGDSGATPAVYNVISFDVGPNIEIIWILMGVWLFPVQFISVLIALFSQVKYAVIPGLITILVAKTITTFLLYYDGVFREQLMKAKDKRLGLCNEGFNGIRVLHMLAWTRPYEARIMDSRTEELRLQNLRLWFQKMAAALDTTLGPMVTLATFIYFVYVDGGEMKASIALPVIGLISSLIGPFGQFPVWMNEYLVWISAYERVNNYMGLNSFSRPSAPVGHRLPAVSTMPEGTCAAFDGCTLSWGSPSDGRPDCSPDAKSEDAKILEDLEAKRPLLEDGPEFVLHDLDVQVKAGELLVLVGQPGHGKTSFLQALLGDMSVERGSLFSPAMERKLAEAAVGSSGLLPANMAEALELVAAGPSRAADGFFVAYAPQAVTLFTGTVRSNILLSVRHDAEVYNRVIQACALKDEIDAMPMGDYTDLGQGGATLSGGQRARVGLSRAVYRAALAKKEVPSSSPLVLLDDPFCALDKGVGREVCSSLLAPGGVLEGCAVITASSDAWWLPEAGRARSSTLHVAVLRDGRVVAMGRPEELQDIDLPELSGSICSKKGAGQGAHRGNPAYLPGPAGSSHHEVAQGNPQDEDFMENAQDGQDAPKQKIRPPSTYGEAGTQTQLTTEQADVLKMVETEQREKGHVKLGTYIAYLRAVTWSRLFILSISLAGIMVFQDCSALWVTYWTSEHRKETFVYSGMLRLGIHQPPEQPKQLVSVYAFFVLFFGLSNVAGHGLEITGGIAAAGTIFKKALAGVFTRPFQWWDANPMGRVLNRFSSDVDVMDLAVTNIIGVIFGAVLYFIGHFTVLAIANPYSLALLPVIAAALEYYARFYRRTIREVCRIRLVCMSAVFQDMVEAILGKQTLQAFAATKHVLCNTMDSLDRFQRVSFTKDAINLWIGFRMAMIGYVLNVFTKLYPVFQFFGYLPPQSAALVGFSIQYSQEVVAIINQFIMNFSDLEMQLISIERLTEYSATGQVVAAPTTLISKSGPGLKISQLEVKYRQGLRPALVGVSLEFEAGKAAAIVGRTGAGKSSLLLSILQLVPYTGTIELDGQILAAADPEDVRRRLIGVVPQQPVIFVGGLRWNLDPDGRETDANLRETLHMVGLQSLWSKENGRLAQDDGQAAISLSQGHQQLLCTARALLRKPKVVLLDEVTASLPSDVAVSTLDTIVSRFKELGTTVLLVTHQEEVLPCCERVITISAGQVAGDRYLQA